MAKKITYDYLLQKGYSKREIHTALHEAILKLAKDKKLAISPNQDKKTPKL